jgi:hypothetical protein
MNSEAMLKEVEKEIQRLQQVAKLLSGDSATASRRGKGKRKLSAAARKKIGDAQRARWAKVKKKAA